MAVRVVCREADLHMITVYHDDWCGYFKGKRCNCDPEITLRAPAPGSLN